MTSQINGVQRYAPRPTLPTTSQTVTVPVTIKNGMIVPKESESAPHAASSTPSRRVTAPAAPRYYPPTVSREEAHYPRRWDSLQSGDSVVSFQGSKITAGRRTKITSKGTGLSTININRTDLDCPSLECHAQGDRGGIYGEESTLNYDEFIPTCIMGGVEQKMSSGSNEPAPPNEFTEEPASISEPGPNARFTATSDTNREHEQNTQTGRDGHVALDEPGPAANPTATSNITQNGEGTDQEAPVNKASPTAHEESNPSRVDPTGSRRSKKRKFKWRKLLKLF